MTIAAPLTSLETAPRFGEALRLEALDIAVDEQTLLPGRRWTLQPGETVTLLLRWSAFNPPPLDAHYFVHLVALGEAAPLAQIDGRLRPDFPTGVWRAGESYNDHLTFALPADLPAGDYQLVLGLYDLTSSLRLPIEPVQSSLPDDRWLIAPIQILPPTS
jgi:hypothetical protein